MGERWTGHLSLHYCARQQALAPHEILTEELHDNVGDVGDVHFVNHAVNRLAELLPHELLMLLIVLALLLHLFEKGPHLEWRHVDAPSDKLALGFQLDHWLFDFFIDRSGLLVPLAVAPWASTTTMLTLLFIASARALFMLLPMMVSTATTPTGVMVASTPWTAVIFSCPAHVAVLRR